MALIDCPKCGFINLDSSKKCIKCGHSLKSQVTPQLQPETISERTQKAGQTLQTAGDSMQGAGKKAGRGCCGMILGVFGFLFLIGSCSALSSKKQSGSSASESAAVSAVEAPTQKQEEETQISEELETLEEPGIVEEPHDESYTPPEIQEIESSPDTESNQKEQRTSREFRINLFLAILKASLNDNIGKGNYKIERDNASSGSEVITVSMWYEGLTLGTLYAKEGDYSAKAQWETMKESVSSFAKKIYSGLEEHEIENTHLLLNILNDVNHDYILLSYMDGVLIYDATDNIGGLDENSH